MNMLRIYYSRTIFVLVAASVLVYSARLLRPAGSTAGAMGTPSSALAATGLSCARGGKELLFFSDRGHRPRASRAVLAAAALAASPDTHDLRPQLYTWWIPSDGGDNAHANCQRGCKCDH